jgi:hypothetical protein
MTDRLPVWTTVVASARTAVAFTRRHPIFFLGLWVLQILVDGLSAMGGSIGYSPSPISPAWTNAVELAQMVLGAPILLALYRFVLGDERSPTYDMVSPRGRKFVAANVAYLICAMMLPGAIFATIHRYAETYGGVGRPGARHRDPRADDRLLVGPPLLALPPHSPRRAGAACPLARHDPGAGMADSLGRQRADSRRCPRRDSDRFSDVALAATPGADHLRLLLECVRAGVSALAELCMICAIGLVYLRLANVPSPRRDAHSRAAARHSPSAIIRLPPTARPGRSAAMLPRMMPMPRMTR